MKIFKILGVTLLSMGMAISLSCAKKPAPQQVVKIGALFSVTGPASFLGAPEAKTVQMLVDQINMAGGVKGAKLEAVIKDTKGDPENAISFAKQLIEEEKVFAIIGPSTSGETMKIKNLCEEAKVLLVSCAAAEVIVNPLAKYVFKVPQKDSQAAIKIFETMKKMGISKIGVVSSNTGFGNAGKEQLEKLAPENSITILISEVYDKTATDLTGVLAKLKSKKVQAVVNWSIEPAQAIVAKNMKQLKMGVPLFQSHGFGNIRYVKEAGEAGEGIIFPCGRLLVADLLPADHPQKSVLTKYKTDYEAKYQEDVSTFGGHAYDALMVLVKSMETAGLDKEQVRMALENLKGFAGTGGVFNFSADDHNGLGLDAFEMLTVKDGKFALLEQK
ncbi:MAG: branched-chain amino acid ABC transporter substrate-binding protein [Candidatus Raymondbacteria bacterium RifOxyA12_full_50_37]|uniref:Branched-chain amino acid ABC transporter substrate-binding protein n=1 Tax=Candidatus Raymondbacteria bacterium RIFOXYD12_FULL_49_13 TaxID=1817890 RepID=A0A1F7F5C9_UNCRA|nr:MAG: branched-chain amino acid ABC transporter substrate-binding protein [Candidatus Raymondbacteria bacterium RIFOXYA2_FULL_49_16]OGJ90120.1 MAG: branched-chain amino acid ABC transporter substrate-binding protein [Candidatus Raymondbacteria bacterium RifOxyA12_full_50_37]OGJ92133.1 MAG: branched-chain amino acid ABC transporter substrate-binding protein [Candidatus Raymondbacteria bacterium RifOxyB12_full_50_8]OGJ97698.1 MAG: branched-chain amino acid ABC transporter substrate-binding prote